MKKYNYLILETESVTLKYPESVLCDAKPNSLYVSNMDVGFESGLDRIVTVAETNL